MPAIKEKAFELIEKMPDDKVVYIVNICGEFRFSFFLMERNLMKRKCRLMRI